MKSIWKDTAKLPAREPLKGELHTDVLIIGGGMAGILCAYMLKQKGVDCVVAERSTVGGGVTGNTTAKITSQHGFLYKKLTKRFGSEKAGLYLQANQEAVKAYQKLCQGIDCDFEEKPAFAYAARMRKCCGKSWRPWRGWTFRHGMYFMKLYQYRSYVMALEGAEDVGGMYIGLEKDTLSLRNYGNYLLIGDIGHPAGKKGEGFLKLEQEKRDFIRKPGKNTALEPRTVSLWMICPISDFIPSICPIYMP